MNLTGKTALVTGSTSGSGLGIAQVLAKAGATLILNGFGDVEAANTPWRSMAKHQGIMVLISTMKRKLPR